MPLPDSGMPVPALLGMEYPDPVGSGLSVPVLGFQTDLFGTGIPLAGTMEDPSGKGEMRHLPWWGFTSYTRFTTDTLLFML